MKKRILIGALIVIVGIGLVFAMSGCEEFLSALSGESQPYGKVINAKDGAALSGVTVSLVPIEAEAPDTGESTKTEEYSKEQDAIQEEYSSNQSEFQVTSDNNGEFDWFDADKTVPRGVYTLKGEKSGYVFFEQKVTVNAVYPDLGQLLGVESDNSGISFILLWDDDYDDVDAYLTYPAKNQEPCSGGTAPAFTTPYDTGSTENPDFSPENFTDTPAERGKDREKIYFQTPSTASDSTATWDSTAHVNTLDLGTFDFDLDDPIGLSNPDSYFISLDVDSTQGGGPETITVRAFPFLTAATNTSTTGGGTTGLASGVDYTWVGVMEYYVDAFDSDWEDDSNDRSEEALSEVETGASADAVLWVIQGTTKLGKYTVPSYTNVKTASLVRVNCFYNNANDKEVYQIVPDIRVLQSTSEVRSLNDDGIIVVEGDYGRR